MNLEIIPVYKNLDAYITGVENGLGSAQELWEKFAIEPYWKTFCQYAPFDLSERKPKPVTDIPSLKKQIYMLIAVNPLSEGFLPWILYVFAHEYHHTVWGTYWYAKHGGELEELFIISLLIDGEADSFAISLYPEIKAKWIFDMTETAEKSLWKDHYSKLVLQRDVDYGNYMFGDASSGIPWHSGCSFFVLSSFF